MAWLMGPVKLVPTGVAGPAKTAWLVSLASAVALFVTPTW